MTPSACAARRAPAPRPPRSCSPLPSSPLLGLLLLAAGSPAQARRRRFAMQPDLHGDLIAFAHAGTSGRSGRGGVARRITFQRERRRPEVLADGARIAFTGVRPGNTDV